MSDEKEVREFLSRWSQRKIDARRAEGEAKPADPPAGPVVPVVPVAVPPSGAGDTTAPMAAIPSGAQGAPLPLVEELRGLESEYRDFLRPEVDESLRRTALKQLFKDPHFNIMDGLDTYIDDYTKADPIPEAMLRGLNQAQGLLFDREDEHEAHAAQPAGTDAVPEQLKSPETASREPGVTGEGDAAQPNPDKPSTAA